jgi:prolyl oligopeptidase
VHRRRTLVPEMHNRAILAAFVLVFFVPPVAANDHAAKPDPLSWLESYANKRVEAWIRTENAKTSKQLRVFPSFLRFYQTSLELRSDSTEDPIILREGPYVYELQKSSSNPRGIWQRTRWQDFQAGEPIWTTLIDVDRLAAREGKPFSLGRTLFRGQRVMIELEGGDGPRTSEWREFDLTAGKFLRSGFLVPPAFEQTVAWEDSDALLVARRGTPNTELNTRTAYKPFVLMRWRRSEPIAKAEPILTGAPDDLLLHVISLKNPDNRHVALATRWDAQEKSTSWIIPQGGSARPLAIPSGVLPVASTNDAIVAWASPLSAKFSQGSLLSIPVDGRRPARVVFAPSPGDVSSFRPSATVEGIAMVLLRKVSPRIVIVTAKGGQWTSREVPVPAAQNITLLSADSASPTLLVSAQGFLLPPTLYALNLNTGGIVPLNKRKPAFEVSRYVVLQYWAKSSDGIEIPYFLVTARSPRQRFAKPTLIWAYGAFGTAELPTYDPAMGRLWLDRGGAFVLANVRGGGEMGPQWHVKGVGRLHTYDDLIAVARDLIRRKLTNERLLALRGHSNGGLLVAVVLNRASEMFHAAVIENPVLDLLAWGGANDPDYGSWNIPEEARVRSETSPYQNLRPGRISSMPFITTNSDDTVYPFMARKYAAKLSALGTPYLFYESPRGVHNLGLTAEDFAFHDALIYSYLWMRLGHRTEVGEARK